MAGIKSRLVKSPPAPKITNVHGGALCAGVCVSRRLVLVHDRNVHGSVLCCLPQGLFDRAGEPVETGIEIAGDVHAQCPPAAFRQDFEIAARLRFLDDAKRI